MSRRRGEFEHRTSIFEGAFRAWSHLGGLDPVDLESKATAELDPLNFPIINDPRLALQKEKDSKKKKAASREGGGSGNNSPAPQDDSGEPLADYPYEPLPRSGLAHPFVQAILSPWLGPDADQDAIQLGLTTLRTWWQHRRKGESGSAVVALGTDKMQGVVEGYTRHFFNLAHCLIVQDKEQPPRSLQTKMSKTRGKKGGKKRTRDSFSDDDAIKAAVMAFNSGFGGGVAPLMSTGPVDAAAMGGGGESMISPLERLQMAQARQLASAGDVHSTLAAGGMGMEINEFPPQIEMKGRCMPGRVDLPSLVQQVSSAATQLAHRGIRQSSTTGFPVPAVDPSKYGDPNITPIVLVTQNGDSQIAMIIDGITCAHCVKIVETVLKGCQGNRSPIDGVLDAAGDQELNLVLIKIEKVADARRIAFEAARNLTMVGYTAVAKSMNIAEVAAKGNNEVTLQNMYSAFESLPHLNPMTVMNWEFDCACPDNNVMRQDCPRHSQMSQGTIEVFDKAAESVTQYVTGCGEKYGMQCTAGNHCFCKADQQHTAELNQYEQPLQQEGSGEEAGAAPRSGRSRLSMRMSLGRMSGRMSLGGLSGLSNLTSGETTFGRAMSGLSALSIDWENMDDFDINVDHSEGINNDIVNAQQQQPQQKGEDNANSMNREPSYDDEAAGPGVGRVARRSSLRKNIVPVNPNMNVSFNM